jgi:hypothetical protein
VRERRTRRVRDPALWWRREADGARCC